MPTPRDRSKRKPAPAVTPADRSLFTTSRGVTVKLAKYSALSDATFEDSVRADWADGGRALPVKPTYTIVALGDVEEVHEHDLKTIKGGPGIPNAEAEWAAWQAAESEFQRAVFDVRVRSYILDCMEFEVPTEWLAKAKAKHLRVPTDPYEAKIFWAQTEVWDGLQDFFNAMAISAELAGVTGPQLEAVREAFRRSLGEGGRAAR